MSQSFALDRSNAKLMGVCSGIANATGWDALLIRLGAVGLTLFVLGPIMILAYLITGWVAD